MKSNRCLYCYEPLDDETSNYHKKCSKKFFGVYPPPSLDFSLSDIRKLAEENVLSQLAVPGVQKKISLGLIDSETKSVKKLTIFGILGDYILKPPTEDYPFLPENESLTMLIAADIGIKTVPNSLIRLQSGELAYITKRIDRNNTSKLAMEDMAQLTGNMTEDKYRSSLEQVAKAILKYSSNPGLDIVKFFEINIFAFLTGNADMHLKNFSIIYENGMYSLAPAYDLLSTRLVIPEKLDNEEFALTMLGKKSKFKASDFIKFAASVNIPKLTIDKLFARYTKSLDAIEVRIANSFLDDGFKEKYINIINERARRLGFK